jgi:FSR family fosmidomycin resistance protein-like MFS transporter
MENVQRQDSRSSMSQLASCLALYGAGHFVVDFACALTVVSLPALSRLEDGAYYYLVILYNLVAFGSQPFWGWILDRRFFYREGLTAGVVLTGIGVACSVVEPAVAAFLLGCGNALFHVGAGALVFKAAPGKASGQGLFVAPGGLGLLAGITLGLRAIVPPIWLAPILVGTALLLYRLVPVGNSVVEPEPVKRNGSLILPAVMALLLCVVALRSFTGFALPVPWKGVVGNGMMFLALASFAGKASGGFLADRIGWRQLCSTMLIIAAAAGICHNTYLSAACIAVFCVQSTTGVTLAAVQSLFPERPGFSFGLPCIALLLGAMPFFLPHPVVQIQPGLIVFVCLSAMTAITVAITMRKKGVV